MQEIIDQLRDHLRGAWRFRWIALAVAAVICFSGWAVIFMMPDRYGASARVYVDTRTALSEVTSGIAVEPGMESQIERVRQQMLGAPALQRVGDEADLFGDAMSAREKQVLIAKLRKEIKISTASGGGGGTGVYVIEYQNRDRDMAVRVVDKLLNTFLEGALGGKRSGSQKAQEFLTDQIADYGKRLSEAESAVAEFKKQYFGVMPGAQGDYYARLQEESTATQQLEADLNGALQERGTLQAQLKSVEPYVSQESSIGTGGKAISATAQRLREAEARLDDLRVRYQDKHPEVILTRETIAELKQKQADELAAAQSGDSAAAALAGLTPNPVRQQVQLDFNKNEVRISSLRANLDSHRAELKRLRGQMDISANVEADFTKLNRDYEVTRTQYLALLQRKEHTQLGEEAQETGVVQTEIIDPPSAPFEPVAPVRAVLIPAVLVIALGAGIGIAYLLDLLKPVFYTARGLKAATGLPVIGVVPRTWLDRQRQDFRRQSLHYWAIVTGLALMAILVTLQQSRITDLTRGFRL